LIESFKAFIDIEEGDYIPEQILSLDDTILEKDANQNVYFLE
jgi:hypothetical protein